MKRWAIYTRYSSDRQNPKSCQDQLHECEARVAMLGGVVVKRYADEATSGAHEAQRPQYLSMITAMKLGTFDALMAEDLDRLNRNLEASARLYSLAVRDEVEIWTIADGRISQMHTGLKGLMGEMFLQQLADKTRRGMLGKARGGTVMAGNCFGYDISGRGLRTINEGQAGTVRRIFDDYASGVSPKSIVTALNRTGVATPRGALWRVSTLIGNAKRLNGILNNPIYIGKPVFNRQRFIKDPETGRRIARPNPPDVWIHQDSPHLRIVSDEAWQGAQARRTGLGAGSRPHTMRRPKTLLSGLVRCEDCGSPMSLNNGYFRCTEHQNSGSCNMNRGVRNDHLENWIFDGLETALDDQELVTTYITHLHSTVARLESERAAKAAEQARSAHEIDRKIDNIMAAIEGGAESASLMARLADLERKKLDFNAVPKVQHATLRVIPDAPARFRRQITELRLFTAQDTPESVRAKESVRAMISRISAGKGSIEVDGNLGAILSYAERPQSLTNGGCGSLQPPLVNIPIVRRVA
jgi:site-specific DNA recombinase